MILRRSMDRDPAHFRYHFVWLSFRHISSNLLVQRVRRQHQSQYCREHGKIANLGGKKEILLCIGDDLWSDEMSMLFGTHALRS